MKIKIMVYSALAAVLLSGCVSEKYGRHEKCEKCKPHEQKCEKQGWRDHHEKRADWQAKLMAEAKISEETARQTALAKVPNGSIKKAELEQEHGKLQWSFDIARPNSKEITEVNVDAMNGNVISVSKESAADDAREGDGENDRK